MENVSDFWPCHYCAKKLVQKGTTCQTWDTDCLADLNVNGQTYLRMKQDKRNDAQSIGIASISDEDKNDGNRKT